MAFIQCQFQACGPLTSVPDSQTLFGSLCFAYKNVHGKEALETMLTSIYTKKTAFAVSSMFLADTLPLPLNIEPALIQNPSQADVALIKKIKKARYISKSLFQSFQDDKEAFNHTFYHDILSGQIVFLSDIDTLVQKDEKEAFSEIKKANALRTRNKVAYDDDEKDLFMMPLIYYSEETRFDVYIKMDDDLAQNVIDALETYPMHAIGGRRSVGINTFELKTITPVDFFKPGAHKILLSKAVVSDEAIDFNASHYKMNTVYNRFDQAVTEKRYKKTLTLLVEGSALYTDVSSVGQLIKEDTEAFDVYHHAIGLLV